MKLLLLLLLKQVLGNVLNHSQEPRGTTLRFLLNLKSPLAWYVKLARSSHVLIDHGLIKSRKKMI